MAETRRKWNPIKKLVADAAKAHGHRLGFFEQRTKDSSFQMAACETCQGVCWVAHSETRGYTGGGRAAKYDCGTKEAMGQR